MGIFNNLFNAITGKPKQQQAKHDGKTGEHPQPKTTNHHHQGKSKPPSSGSGRGNHKKKTKSKSKSGGKKKSKPKSDKKSCKQSPKSKTPNSNKGQGHQSKQQPKSNAKTFKKEEPKLAATPTKPKSLTSIFQTPAPPRSTIGGSTLPTSMLLSQIPAPAMRLKRRGLGSSASLLNLTRELTSPHLLPSGTDVSNVYHRVYSCLVLVMHCPVHSKLALVRSPTGAVWLPYVPMATTLHGTGAQLDTPTNSGVGSWYSMARKAVAMVCADGNSALYDAYRRAPPYDQLQLLNIFRCQVPQTRKFVTRMIFYARMVNSNQQQGNGAKSSKATPPTSTIPGSPVSGVGGPKTKGFICCTNHAPGSNGTLLWAPMDQIMSGTIHHCWGPELMEYCHLVKDAADAAQQVNNGQQSPKSMFKQSSYESRQSGKSTSTKSSGKSTCQELESSLAPPTLKQPPYNLRQTLDEFGIDELFHLLPKKDAPPTGDSYQDSLKQIQIPDTAIERLYTDFLDHCYPCFSMTYDSFKHYILKNGFESDRDRILRMFYAANDARSGALNFSEVFRALIYIERDTPHAEFRIKFIFNLYDHRRRGYLTEEDLRDLVVDLNVDPKTHEPKRPLTEADIASRTKEVMACFKTKPCPAEAGRPVVSYVHFVNAIGGHRMRGTSSLARAWRMVFSTISHRITARNMRLMGGSTKGRMAGVITKKNYPGLCEACLERKYKVVSHLTVFGPDGYARGTEPLVIATAQPVEEKPQAEAATTQAPPTETTQLPSLEPLPSLEEDEKNPVSNVPSEPMVSDLPRRSESSDSGSSSNSLESEGSREGVILDLSLPSPSSPAMQLIQAIRDYNRVKSRKAGAVIMVGTGPPSAPPTALAQQRMSGVLVENPELLVKLLRSLTENLVPILDAEPRCRPVPSPTFIIGDIHGNLEDLMSLERTIWRRFPELNGMHYLFLGDYVDRGRWSIECALYLAAMKLVRPQCITLLRGNHEVRPIQIKYTYSRECVAKYGPVWGEQVFVLTNRIFDHLPVCAVVDGNVFAAHGGIPHVVQIIAEINETVPDNVPDPEHESTCAWEIMWTDPMEPAQFRELYAHLQATAALNPIIAQQMAALRPGYLPNPKRGTAYYFNDEGADKFLEANGLSHIVRAHEVPKAGYESHFNFKCTTIFSCSHYCGNDNDCAVILVDGAWMRIIRIDTSSNVSATDGL